MIKLDDVVHNVYELPIGFSAGFIECYACLASVFACLFLISFSLGLSATFLARSLLIFQMLHAYVFA